MNICRNAVATSVRLARTTVTRALARDTSSVGYIGWIGHGNLGDEAMLAAARTLLSPRNVTLFDGARREKLLAAVGLSGPRRFSSVFLGGGTLINPGYRSVVETAISLGLDISTLGTGVGSSGFSKAPDVAIKEWGPLLRQFRHVGVRGPRSLRLLQGIGVEHAEVVGDLALALARDYPNPCPDNEHYALNVAVPGSSDPDFPTSQMIEEMSATVAHLGQCGLRPLPLAFSEEDRAPTAAVASHAMFGAPDVILVKRHDQLFRLLDRCRFSLGVRLHSAVLATCAGVPPILVGYCDKCADFMESMELMDWHVDAHLMTLGKLAGLAATMIDSASALRPTIVERASAWRGRLREYARNV